MHQSLGLEEIGPRRWDSFVEPHPAASVYHLSAWHQAIQESYGHEARYWVQRNKAGDIEAGLPYMVVRNMLLGRRLVAFPYSDYCDPLAADPASRKALTDSLARHCRQAGLGGLEIRLYRTLSERDAPAQTDHLNYELELNQSADSLLAATHKSCVQRAVSKAQRSGLRVIEDSSEQALRSFYGLHVLTRRRLGVPVQPLSFFRNLAARLASAGGFRLILARGDSGVAAAMIFLDFAGVTYYKYGASDLAARGRRPNHLLLWHAIRGAVESGRQRFDFGRASTSEPGLAQFKRRWGAVGRPIDYLTLPGKRSHIGRLESGAWSAARGALRHMPPWLLRLSGNVLYRHLG